MELKIYNKIKTLYAIILCILMTSYSIIIPLMIVYSKYILCCSLLIGLLILSFISILLYRKYTKKYLTLKKYYIYDNYLNRKTYIDRTRTFKVYNGEYYPFYCSVAIFDYETQINHHIYMTRITLKKISNYYNIKYELFLSERKRSKDTLKEDIKFLFEKYYIKALFIIIGITVTILSFIYFESISKLYLKILILIFDFLLGSFEIYYIKKSDSEKHNFSDFLISLFIAFIFVIIMFIVILILGHKNINLLMFIAYSIFLLPSFYPVVIIGLLLLSGM